MEEHNDGCGMEGFYNEVSQLLGPAGPKGTLSDMIVRERGTMEGWWGTKKMSRSGYAGQEGVCWGRILLLTLVNSTKMGTIALLSIFHFLVLCNNLSSGYAIIRYIVLLTLTAGNQHNN